MMEIQKARSVLKQCDALLITAGAGMGVDSGLPDFRGPQGLWRAYPPLMEKGLTLPQMSTPSMFDTDPELAWGFFGHRHQLYSKTKPHDGFKMLLELANSKKHGAFVFTSNVDGHFQKAGFKEEQVHEVHGSIHHLQCTSSCTNHLWSADSLLQVPEFKEVTNHVLKVPRSAFPKCPRCKALARPNILMFGDYTWIEKRAAQQEDNMEKWIRTVQSDENAHLAIVEIGAGESVPTVRWFSEMQQKRLSGRSTLIRVNPRDTKVPAHQISLPMGGLEALSQIASE
jgi:NAD-dependent SIR2 family protein deacetylase